MARKKYDGTWVRRIPGSVQDEDALYSILEYEGLTLSFDLGQDEAGAYRGSLESVWREDDTTRLLWDDAGCLHAYINVHYDFADCMWSEKDAAKYARLGVTGEEFLCLEIRLWVEDNHAGIWVECDEPYRIGWEVVNVEDETVLGGPKTGYYPCLPKLAKFPD